MGSKLVGTDTLLGVGGEDLRAIKAGRRRETLAKVGHVLAPAASAILGILAGNEAYPVHARPASFYPYASSAVLMTSSFVSSNSRQRWTATLVISVIVFIVAFVSLAFLNGAVNSSFGVSPKYGAYSGRYGY